MDEHMSDHLNQRGRNYLLELERERYQTIENTVDIVSDLEDKFHTDEMHDHDGALCCWEQGSRHFFGSFTKSLHGVTHDDFSIVRINAEGDGKFVRLLNVDQSSQLSADTMISSSFITRSDKRLKKNIKKLEYDPTIIHNLNIVSFNYIGKTETTIGMIAQEVQKINTNLVKEDKETQMLSISYNDILCLTIQHAQHLESRLVKLESQLPLHSSNFYVMVSSLHLYAISCFTTAQNVAIFLIPSRSKIEGMCLFFYQTLEIIIRNIVSNIRVAIAPCKSGMKNKKQ